MGRTLATFTQLVQQEIDLWSRYRRALRREDQQALSSYFAGGWKEAAPPPFKFVPSAAGPRLQGALASLGCELERIVDGGDHWMVIGRVTALHRGVEPLRPLGWEVQPPRKKATSLSERGKLWSFEIVFREIPDPKLDPVKGKSGLGAGNPPGRK